MGAFASWLLGFVQVVVEWFYNSTIDLLQGAIDGFATFILTLIELFPAGPAVPSMPVAPPAFAPFITCLNWLFPVSYLVTMVTFVTTGMVIYFTIAPLARWAKLLN